MRTRSPRLTMPGRRTAMADITERYVVVIPRRLSLDVSSHLVLPRLRLTPLPADGPTS